MAPRKTDDAPSGEVKDDSYVTGDTKGEAAPVISDDATIEDPIDDKVADSDAQLGKLSTPLPLGVPKLTSISRAR